MGRLMHVGKERGKVRQRRFRRARQERTRRWSGRRRDMCREKMERLEKRKVKNRKRGRSLEKVDEVGLDRSQVREEALLDAERQLTDDPTGEKVELG